MFTPFVARAAERLTRPLWALGQTLHERQCAFMRQRIMPALLRQPPRALPPLDVEVGCLVSKTSWLMALWMARSFDHHAEVSWQHVWYDDGTLTSEDVARAQHALPRLRVIRHAESDRMIEPILATRPNLRAAVNFHPMFRRALLLSLPGAGDRIISIDSDVLFFAIPREILAWARDPVPRARHMYDPITYYFPAESILSDWLGRPVASHVNGGLVLFPRGWLDYDLTERFFAAYFGAAGRTLHIEQSLLAINLTPLNPVPLSREYELTFHPRRRAYSVARHYVSDGPTRDYFYTEGIGELSRFLLV